MKVPQTQHYVRTRVACPHRPSALARRPCWNLIFSIKLENLSSKIKLLLKFCFSFKNKTKIDQEIVTIISMIRILVCLKNLRAFPSHAHWRLAFHQLISMSLCLLTSILMILMLKKVFCILRWDQCRIISQNLHSSSQLGRQQDLKRKSKRYYIWEIFFY